MYMYIKISKKIVKLLVKLLNCLLWRFLNIFLRLYSSFTLFAPQKPSTNHHRSRRNMASSAKITYVV